MATSLATKAFCPSQSGCNSEGHGFLTAKFSEALREPHPASPDVFSSCTGRSGEQGMAQWGTQHSSCTSEYGFVAATQGGSLLTEAIGRGESPVDRAVIYNFFHLMAHYLSTFCSFGREPLAHSQDILCLSASSLGVVCLLLHLE